MIKHLLTLIWNQRNGNVWIFLELLLVTAMLWVMADSLLVDTYTYQQPSSRIRTVLNLTRSSNPHHLILYRI